MVRKVVRMMMLGVVLCASVICAQDEADTPKKVRFDALVKVVDLQGALQVKLPNATEFVAAMPYKAYPYGTVFTATDKARFRVIFSDLTYMVIQGPVTFTPVASDLWQKVSIQVKRGDFNVSVDQRAQPEQFEIVTPLGTFASLRGMSKLHVGDIAKGVVTKEDFSFRTLSGEAVFNGLHYSMANMTQANAFVSADVDGFYSSDVMGRSGEVKMDLPSGGGKNTPFSLTPGATVKITRAKARASDNWVVSVLTLYANGEAKNYFCYVENRGDGYCTGELIAEVLPEEVPVEDDGTDEGEDNLFASDEPAVADELTDFDGETLF